MREARVASMLAAGLGALALALTAVGLFGLMAYSVTQRTREIGVRMALGARGSDVVLMTVWQGLRLTAIGLVNRGARGVLFPGATGGTGRSDRIASNRRVIRRVAREMVRTCASSRQSRSSLLTGANR